MASWLSGRRRRAERAAERIFEMSPALLAVAGFDGYLRRSNPAFAVFGYSREELLARPWIEFVHPDDRERMGQAMASLERGDEVVELENRVVCRDGSLRRVVWSTRIVPDERLFYAAGRDVTESRRAADEQAALRRIATLVAQHKPQSDVFAAIAGELGRLLELDSVQMVRFDDGDAVVVAGWGGVAEAAPGAAVEAPILVQGRRWGAMIATSSHDAALPAGTESRMREFTELMATAIANAEARGEVARLAAEQAALRRVATLVAEGAASGAVFDAVIAEVSEVLDASAVTLARYDGDELVVLAHLADPPHLQPGRRLPMEPGNLTAVVRRTGRTARGDEMMKGSGAIADILRRAGVRSTVAAPVVVDGRTWGVLAASWLHGPAPPADTEERMARFAQLLDTAIANADSRDQLTASRARVLAAADDARRRVVRDLHDGAQQRLVHTIVTLKLARQALRDGGGDTETLVEEGLGYAEGAIADLRELSHGILPAGLMRGGLGAALDALVARLELPVEVDVSPGRLPREVEASAYFIVAEGLTNVVKHAGATHAVVTAAVEDGCLRIEVRDDGAGGANPEGFGLLGIADRVAALGGELWIESESPGGTVLAARLPLSASPRRPSLR